MAGDDWFRNTDWDAAIEGAFRAKLSRSRSSRPQYLKTQASYMADRHPHVSLALIEEYFETGDEFFTPDALCTRAAAYRTLGKIDEAVAAYKRALEWESGHPHFITTARIELPKLIAERRRRGDYAYALDILVTRFRESDHQIPDIRYEWNGCNALIASDLGDATAAREFAERAIRAAAKTSGPFWKHRSFGVVGDTSDDFGNRIKRIAKPSKLQALVRRFTGT